VSGGVGGDICTPVVPLDMTRVILDVDLFNGRNTFNVASMHLNEIELGLHNKTRAKND
jgi:hypothetical protein